MRKTNIFVTKAARNFAKLVPDGGKVCTGRDLAAVLATTELTKDEAIAWRRNLRTARKILKVPVEKWR
jgi:hypothetical protein